MSASPDSPISGTSATPQQASHRIIIVLLLVVAVLLALVSGTLLTRGTERNATAASPGQIATATATPPEKASSEPTAEPTDAAATPETGPAHLALLREEITRDPDDARARGSVDAPVVMVVYSDFAGPDAVRFARDVEPSLSDLVDDGTLRIEWRDVAQASASSTLAAQAGIAAADQGRFWEFHDALYAAAPAPGTGTEGSTAPADGGSADAVEYTTDSLVALAEQAGVPDLDRFRLDLDSDATVAAVARARQHAQDLGITTTPFLLVNDTTVVGYTSADVVRTTVLDRATAAGATAEPTAELEDTGAGDAQDSGDAGGAGTGGQPVEPGIGVDVALGQSLQDSSNQGGEPLGSSS